MVNKGAEQQLIDGMPDLVLSVTRDCTLLSFGGGRGVPQLVPRPDSAGKPLSGLWSESLTAEIQRMVRKAITTRRPLHAELTDGAFTYQVRAMPEGPDRALCVLRAQDGPRAASVSPANGSHPQPYADRRDFLRCFEDRVAVNALTERPLALVTLLLDGVDDIARLDAKLAVGVVTAALVRLSQEMSVEQSVTCTHTGQLSEDQLAFVVQTDDRRTLEDLVAQLQASLGAPLLLDQNTFTLRCFAGVALLGRDANSTQGLLDNARLAAGEARRAGSRKARFFSDTIKMKALARIDIARELRDAIEANAIQARYRGRHDLQTGRLVAWVAYVRWPHALRGDIPAKEFIGVAEVTGTALALSRALLAAIARDVERLQRQMTPDTCISYGPLRQHLLHGNFLGDIREFLALTRTPAAQFEVRIAEATFVALPGPICAALKSLGIQIVVDEVARGPGSLDRIARAPLWGIQLDRAWVAQVHEDEVARRICRAGVAMAAALNIEAIATGIDDEAHRRAVMELGCRFGSGDLFAAISMPDAPGAAQRAG